MPEPGGRSGVALHADRRPARCGGWSTIAGSTFATIQGSSRQTERFIAKMRATDRGYGEIWAVPSATRERAIGWGGRGQSRADQQLGAVAPRHLLHDVEVPGEGVDRGVDVVDLLDEQPSTRNDLGQPAIPHGHRIGQVGEQVAGEDDVGRPDRERHPCHVVRQELDAVVTVLDAGPQHERVRPLEADGAAGADDLVRAGWSCSRARSRGRAPRPRRRRPRLGALVGGRRRGAGTRRWSGRSIVAIIARRSPATPLSP